MALLPIKDRNNQVILFNFNTDSLQRTVIPFYSFYVTILKNHGLPIGKRYFVASHLILIFGKIDVNGLICSLFMEMRNYFLLNGILATDVDNYCIALIKIIKKTTDLGTNEPQNFTNFMEKIVDVNSEF